MRMSDSIEAARRSCPVLGTVFANLSAGKQSVQPTALANTPRGNRPITVRDGLLKRCVRGAGCFRAGLEVAMMEFEDEMRKQGVGLTTELEYWAYVDDITIATTAELAPIVMGRLEEILERHGLELKKRQVHSLLPNIRKSRWRQRRNDAIREMDSRWPHDPGSGQRQENIGRRSRQGLGEITSQRAEG